MKNKTWLWLIALLCSFLSASRSAEGAQLSQQAKLGAADGTSGDFFGRPLSFDGSTFVVGAYGKAGKGAAYVFVRSGAGWVQQQKLLAADGAISDGFGTAVAISGDTIVVGAMNNLAVSGYAYVFVRSGTVWTQQQKLLAADAAAGDEFGLSVAVSGDLALVGAPGKATNTGAAYLFSRSGSSWVQQQKILAADASTNSNFGYSATLGSDTAVIGAVTRASSAGGAYAFVRNGASWTQQQLLLAADAVSGDHFGVAVATSGDTTIIGARSKDGSAGAAYVFTRAGASWSAQQKLTASDAAANSNFGWSVALTGDSALIGAYGAMSSTGAVYSFARSGSAWTQQQVLSAADGAPGDHLAFVATDGVTALAGAVGKASFTGAVYVFGVSGAAPALGSHAPWLVALLLLLGVWFAHRTQSAQRLRNGAPSIPTGV